LSPRQSVARSAYADKRVLVTGGAGYLANALVQTLSTQGAVITRLCRPGGSLPEDVPEPGDRIDVLVADVRDASAWSRALRGADFVFHLAAQTSVPRAAADPQADHEVNAASMLRLLEACRAGSYAPVIVSAGTATQAGIPARLPVDDTHPDSPTTIYDLHKLFAELYLKQYTGQGWVRGVTLRLANVYGPGPTSGSADRGILNKMVRTALNREPLRVFGSGEYLRDYVYIDDVAAAFLAAGACIERVQGRSFVVGTGVGHTVRDAVNMVADRVAVKTGSRVPVLHVDPPQPLLAIERRNFVADSTRFREATGWIPHVALAEGIDRTIAYLAARAVVTR
jgi:nucleoside-diphosphate-sugar epimerase